VTSVAAYAIFFSQGEKCSAGSQLLVHLEISAGNDISPFAEHFWQFTSAACVIYTTISSSDAFYSCMNW
jgi:hypothetical protein